MDTFLFFATSYGVISWSQMRSSRDAQERVCTVHENNVPTTQGHLRYQVRRDNLWHRATYILVRWIPAEGEQQILVQRRSLFKDYAPGKLDPTPGGVVEYGEDYRQNAIREMLEEMGIDVTKGNPQGNRLDRLFTFPYQDQRVRVWGACFEIEYRGSLEELTIQTEEVDEVLCMTRHELEQRILDHPDDFPPDSLHALKLYLQRRTDVTVRRRMLKEYSSGDLEHYQLRPPPQVVFFDCDDTLYWDGWKTANQLTAKIEEWCTTKVGLPPGKAYDLYKQYGTALRGLLAEGYVENNPAAIDSFLQQVHDIPIDELLQPDPELRKLLLQMDPSIPKYIFTASVHHHATRCLKALGIEDLFESTIIDVLQCDLHTKYSQHSFETAMRIAGVKDPEACIFLDDSVRNIQAARAVGWRSVLVGKVGRDCGKPIQSDHAELQIERVHDMVRALPELFQEGNPQSQ